MRKAIRTTIIWLLIIIAVGFIVNSFRKARPTNKVAEAPKLNSAPVRVYGRTEPRGQEYFVSSPVTRRVVQVLVQEGETLAAGQVLCRLDSAVEQAEYASALARIEVQARALAISEDLYQRSKALFAKNGIAESEVTQYRLKTELDRANLAASEQAAQSLRAQLDQMTLRAPRAGRLYRFDVRLGQTLTAGDNTRIVMGAPEIAARLYIEAWWVSRVKLGDRYKLHDAETSEYLGTGAISYLAPYLGRRDFRTDDAREKLDTDYLEAVLDLTELTRLVPTGLKVVAELVGE